MWQHSSIRLYWAQLFSNTDTAGSCSLYLTCKLNLFGGAANEPYICLLHLKIETSIYSINKYFKFQLHNFLIKLSFSTMKRYII